MIFTFVPIIKNTIMIMMKKSENDIIRIIITVITTKKIITFITFLKEGKK